MQLPVVTADKTADSLPPIQALWVGNSLSPIEQLSIKSFLALGHPYHLYTYEDIANVPEGTTIKDANKIISFSKFFLCPHRKYTPFSDWFRWELLNKQGGYWMDTDMIALKPVIFDEEFIISFQNQITLNVAFLKFPANHFMSRAMARRCSHPKKVIRGNIFKFIKQLIDMPRTSGKIEIIKIYRKILEIAGHCRLLLFPNRRSQIFLSAALGSIAALSIDSPECQLKFTEGGDKILSRAKPPVCFYPINHKEFMTLFDETYRGIEQPFPNSYTVHIWTQMFDFTNTSKTDSIHPESFIGRLVRKHSIESGAVS